MNPDVPQDGSLLPMPAPGDEPESLLEALRSRGYRPDSWLLDDGDAPEPPRNLAARTIARVDAQREPAVLPFRRRVLDWLPIPEVVPMRWADVAVAAGVFLAGALAWIPANHRQMMQASQLACLSNLQQLGTALNRYAATHDSYPYPDPNGPIGFNGSYVSILNDDNQLEPDRTALLHCPSAARGRLNLVSRTERLPSTEELVTLRKHSYERFCQALQNDYAYHRGFQEKGGPPRPVPARLIAAVMPLLADQPGYDGRGRILRGNSPNHGGSGQNVLYTDGHASWSRNRFLHTRDQDIFLNEHGLPAPGIHVFDSSLGPAPLPIVPD